MTAADLFTENATLREEIATTQLILDGIDDAVMVVDEEGKLVHQNAAAASLMTRSDPEAWSQARTVFRSDGVTVYPPDEFPLERARRGETVHRDELLLRGPRNPDGVWIQCDARPIRGADGTVKGAVAIYRDITERKQHERRMEQQLLRERERNDQLELMRAAIEQLSTPILEVWDDVLAIPIVGVIDSSRAADMTARVLEAVERSQCRFLLIDITGVDVIDTATADRFLKLVTAVEILGARCFLTGARAIVAQTLASLGMDLGGMTTFRSLKHGLRECIRTMDAAALYPVKLKT